MHDYIILITIIGLAALGMAFMPSISRKTGISYSIFYVLLGIMIYAAVGSALPLPNPISQNKDTLRITEMVVIVSLMGTGLKIDQPFSIRNWAAPFRLVSVTMILSIAIVSFAAFFGFRFDLASALLLGAVLAPTDPVLASDVQVGPPLEDTKDKIRFSLTAEAGMNDGTAFPFVWLAILTANYGQADLIEWVWFELLYKIIAGVICGILVGKGIAYIVFRLPARAKDFRTRDGFVALSATLLAYGITELAQGYGFIAVFATAVTIRNAEMHHKYHKKLHDFTDQVERIMIAIVLILFGGSLISGILKPLTWQMVVFGIVFIFLIRPATGMIGLIRTRLHLKEKLAISFFGIRGMGSFFYLAFALQAAYFSTDEQLWAVTAFIVLLSIIIHGLSATPVMKKLEADFVETADHVQERPK